MQPFDGFDLDSLWEESEYANREYVDAPLTSAVLARVEERLGFKLPASYVALAQRHNGGVPRRTAHRTAAPTSWAPDHVAITGIYSIGSARPNSLCGQFGSPFWVSEWGYPNVGVYFADCPSAGLDMLCLDYRACGPSGEPRVVHVDQESNFKITLVALTFEAFIRGLESDESINAA